MSKGIVFNEQLEARNSGAKMFLVPITHPNALTALQEYEDGEYRSEEKEFFEEIIRFYAPLQKGDEFFIQEEFGISGMMKHLLYKDEYPEDKNLNWIPASQMQEHQARFKDVVLDVEVNRAWDLTASDFMKLGYKYDYADIHGTDWIDNPLAQTYEYHNRDFKNKEEWFLFDLVAWFNSQYGNFSENPYVFLYTIRGIE